MRLPTAEELDLFDYEAGEGMAISCFPPAQEHFEDPWWYDSGGRNPFYQKRVHKLSAGEERQGKLKEILEQFPRYGPKMYEWAVERDDPDLIKELFDLGVSFDIKAAKEKNPSDDDEEVDEDGQDPYPTVSMEPALHLAAYKGKLECVKVLVKCCHLDVNARDDNDTTPLTNALIEGHERIVSWLLERGANITFGGSAEELNDLRAALRSSKVPLVKRILEHPQSVERKLHIQVCDLRYAAKSLGDPSEAVRYVLESDCFQGRVTRDRRDELFNGLGYAIAAASIESVRLVLQFLTKQHEDGSFDYVEMTELEEGPIFNASEDAMEKRDIPELFELVWETLLCRPPQMPTLQEQPKLSVQDKLHRRLISSCAEGCPETCRLIVDKYGANVNHVSHKFGTTPLGRVAGSPANPLERRLPVGKYLLEEKHADIHLGSGKYANGPTPLALILEKGGRQQTEMIKLLLKHGGPLEEIPEDALKKVEGAEASANVKLHLVVREVARHPVRLYPEKVESEDDQGKNITAQGDSGNDEGKYIQAEVEASKEEWQTWLKSMQIRKSDEELAADDPKGRKAGPFTSLP